MEDLIQQLKQSDPLWAYFFLFISAFVENIFPPIPGDTVTLVGAYLVGIGFLNFWGVLFATTAGSILGFMTIFGVAYWLEWKVIEKYQPRWVSVSRINRVENWFRRYGYWIILFNRFLSGARSVISFVAGLSKMHVFRVFVLALISCTVWNGTLIYLGSLIGKNWQEIVELLKTYNRIVFIALVVLLAIYGGYRFFVHRKGNAP